MEFTIGGVAAMGAGFFTNPIEVLKTRMQLQGELQSRGQHTVHYRNILQAGYVIAKNDGVLALQKGLVPALCVQFILNGTRLGIYQFFDNRGYIKDHKGNVNFLNAVWISSIGGIIGHWICTPFFLVKTHLQVEAAKAIAVGYQHHHKGTLEAMRKIYSKEGVSGIFRGATASIPRALFGSSAQLVSFEYSKQYLSRYNYFKDKPIFKAFIGSMIGGVGVTIAITPFDLVLVRLQNQPTDEKGRGKLYSSYMDCISKIYKSEGSTAFYKGIGPMYLRLAPHTVLCLVFWDRLSAKYRKYLEEKRPA